VRWVTPERPTIDRIACSWLIVRFIDQQAEFFYVAAERVLPTAIATGAVPYDIPGVELSRTGKRCSFDAFLAKYRLTDPALRRLAVIVRGASTSRLNLEPRCAGLYAITLGLSAIFSDDHEMLRHGLVLCDALRAWCARVQDEKPDWPLIGKGWICLR
jgi:hypothetical protein